MLKRIKPFFIEEDLASLLGWLGIEYKKAIKNRIIHSIIIGLLMVVMIIIMKKLYLLPMSILVAIIYYKYQYYSLKKTRTKLIKLKRRMFPNLVKKLLILLRTNNIYVSLNKLLEFTDDPIKKYLKQLIIEIDNDKSIQPYNNFANNMEFIEAHQVMKTLHTFVEKAKSKEHLESLEKMIFQLYNNEIEDTIEAKKRLMWLYPNLTILTMIAIIFALVIYMLTGISNGVMLG